MSAFPPILHAADFSPATKSAFPAIYHFADFSPAAMSAFPPIHHFADFSPATKSAFPAIHHSANFFSAAKSAFSATHSFADFPLPQSQHSHPQANLLTSQTYITQVTQATPTPKINTAYPAGDGGSPETALLTLHSANYII